MKIKWDQVGERIYETGTDRGVFYPLANGVYTGGVPWNGLTSVSESPSGGEPTPLWADNIKYLNLMSAEEFAATVESYTYPDEFAECDGTASPIEGMSLGQQNRKPFGLCYRTKVGNDTDGADYGYKLHLVYGCLAAPSQKDYETINDNPDGVTFSWELSTTPVEVGTINGVAYKPVATIVLDSTKLNATKLAALEDILYGTDGEGSGSGTEARLPLPDEVYNILSAA